MATCRVIDLWVQMTEIGPRIADRQVLGRYLTSSLPVARGHHAGIAAITDVRAGIVHSEARRQCLDAAN